MDTTSQAVSRIDGLVADYNRKLRLARATDMAKSGRFLEAESLLHPLGGKPEGARELDLLARIALRRWRLEKARRFWEAAMRAEPANEQYVKCLKKLNQWEEKAKCWAKIAGIGLVAFAVAILVILSVRSLFRHHPQVAIPPQHTEDGKAKKTVLREI